MQRLVANLIAQTGITSINGQIAGDESYFDSVRGTPATGGLASPEVEGVLSGLAYDRGLANEQGTAFQNRPALFAAQQFALALRAAGIKVPSATPVVSRRHRRAQGYRRRALAADGDADRTHEHSVGQLRRGDAAEGDRRALRRARHDRGRGCRRPIPTAQSFGIEPRLNDGSGLSRTIARRPAMWSRRCKGSRAIATSSIRCRSPARRARLVRAAGHPRAGPLPRQDRHASRCRRRGRLLHRARWSHAGVRVPDELGRSNRGACNRGPDDRGGREVRRLTSTPGSDRLTHLLLANSPRKPSSSTTATPSCSALASFEPGLSPATTYSVLREPIR